MTYFYLALSGILYGGIVFGGKILLDRGASVLDVIIYPNLIVMAAIVYAARHDLKKAFQVPVLVSALFLIAMTLIMAGQYVPLKMGIPVSMVVLLLYLQPLWTILIERFFFGKKQPLENWVLTAAMLTGMVILIHPSHTTAFSLPGILIGTGGGLGLSLWVIITQSFTQRRISPYATLFAASMYSVIPALIAWPFIKTAGPSYVLTGGDTAFWGIMIFYSLAAMTLPNILLFKHNRAVPAAVIGMMLLLEPVSGIALDVIFLDTPVTRHLLTGGGIILLSNLILVLPPNNRGTGRNQQ